MKKLPKSCTVVAPNGASKSIVIKCSSVKEAREALAALGGKADNHSKSSSRSPASKSGRPSLLFAAAVVHRIGQKLRKSGQRKPSKKTFEDASKYATAEMRRRGYTKGNQLTAEGVAQQSHQKRKSAHVFKTYDRYKREALGK